MLLPISSAFTLQAHHMRDVDLAQLDCGAELHKDQERLWKLRAGWAHRQVLLICELCSCTMASSACSTSAATSRGCPSSSSSAPLSVLVERPCCAWLAAIGAPKTTRTCNAQPSTPQACALPLRVRIQRQRTHQRAEVLCVERGLYGVRDAVMRSNGGAWVGVAV